MYKTKTPYHDINLVPIYTGNVVKHYLNERLDYDIGVVHQDASSGNFYRTSLLVDKTSILSQKECDLNYFILGDITEDPADIAVTLFKTLGITTFYESAEGEGVLNFLEKFKISGDQPTLTVAQKERALHSIVEYFARLRRIY